MLTAPTQLVGQGTQDNHSKFISNLKLYSKAIIIGILLLNLIFLVLFFAFGITLIPFQVAIVLIFTSLGILLKFNEEASGGMVLIAHLLSILTILYGVGVIGSYFFTSLPFLSNISFVIGLNTLFLGLAVFTFHNSLFSHAKTFHFFAFLVGIIPLYAFIGYGYTILEFSRPKPLLLSDIQINVSFFLLSYALFLSRPNHGLMRILTTPLSISSTARWTLISVCVVPIILGYLRIVGQNYGLFTFETGISLFVICTILFFTIVVWAMANRIYKYDINQIKLNEDLRSKSTRLEALDKELEDKVGELEKSKEEIKRLLYHQDRLSELDA